MQKSNGPTSNQITSHYVAGYGESPHTLYVAEFYNPDGSIDYFDGREWKHQTKEQLSAQYESMIPKS